MTAWASLLVPAAGVAVGGIITGGAAIWGQVVTHRGTYEREREARRDAFKVKRYEIERDTLIALQEVLGEHNKAWNLLHAHNEGLFPNASTDQRVQDAARLGNAVGTIAQLKSRVLDNDARTAVDQYMSIAHTQGSGQEATLEGYRKAQRALGEANRRDPFESEG